MKLPLELEERLSREIEENPRLELGEREMMKIIMK